MYFSINLTLGIRTKHLHSTVRSRKPLVVPTECPNPKPWPPLPPQLKVPEPPLQDKTRQSCVVCHNGTDALIIKRRFHLRAVPSQRFSDIKYWRDDATAAETDEPRANCKWRCLCRDLCDLRRIHGSWCGRVARADWIVNNPAARGRTATEWPRQKFKELTLSPPIP